VNVIRRIAGLLVIVCFAVFVVGRYLYSLPGYQYDGPIPPELTYSVIGLFGAFLGIAILAADFLRKKFVLPAREKLMVMVGWTLVVAGLIATPVAALEDEYCISCSFNTIHWLRLMFSVGIIAVLGGLTLVAAAFLAWRLRSSARGAVVHCASAGDNLPYVVWVGSIHS
jgi:hypothetical protein